MKKRSFTPLLINTICGFIILVLLIIMAFNEKYDIGLYTGVLVALGGVIIIASGVCSYFVNDRLFGFLGFVGAILAMIGNRALFINPIEGYITIPTVLILLVQLASIASFSGSLLAIYRLPINGQTFDNKIFGEINPKQGLTMLLFVVNALLLLIIILDQVMLGVSVITPTVCIIALVALTFGKMLVFFYHKRIGSLIVFLIPFVLILGINPKEVSLDNTCVIIMLLEYLASILLALLEFVKVTPAEEAKIGPKEYKEK